jgi:S1-C subfamily serine protease
MRRTLAAGAVLAVIAGCGGGSGGGATQTVTQRATHVDVIPGAGDARFDARRIYDREAQGVVTVISVFSRDGLTSLFGGDKSAGLGSGFVVSDGGEVATNAHVVTQGEGRDLQRADHVYVQFRDRNQVPARIVGVDPNADVALLRVDPDGLDLRPLPLANPDSVQVGEPVAAIGSPYGERQSLSVGVVSAVDRSIESLTGFAIGGAIQTDAAINHGNSGGPLLDGHGRVLGINSQIRSATGEGTGVGFAVDSGTVRHSLQALRDDHTVDYAYLGVATRSVYPQLADHFDLGTDGGAWVQSVTSGGPAAKAGLHGGTRSPETFQAQRYRSGGDVIVALAGRKVTEDADLARILIGHQPGQRVRVALRRDGAPRTVTVRLGRRPATTSP